MKSSLIGELVYLRALEPEDLSFIYKIENDETIWELSNTQTPFSKFIISQYLENSHRDIYEVKQLRLIICDLSTDKSVGIIDLFDFDPKNLHAGIGIIVNEKLNRNKGYGSEALELLVKYSFNHLHLHQLYANINTDNQASIRLFIKFGFECVGIKKEWNKVGSQWKDESLYQLLNK